MGIKVVKLDIMPMIQIQNRSIYYETHGLDEGIPLLLLHAGWGRFVNGFESQIAALSDQFQLIIPDREGYGKSSRVETLRPDYHREAVPHMLAVMDHLGILSAHLWGHSDGAVVGAWLAITSPERVRSLIFEGGHLEARKDRMSSRAFMLRTRDRPDTLPPEIRAALAAGHGADYWKKLLWLWTEAWRLLYERGGDIYEGRLKEIRCPTLVMHGGQDPHTSLSEMARLANQIPGAETLFLSQAGHCLHDDPSLVEMVHHKARAFFLGSQPSL